MKYRKKPIVIDAVQITPEWFEGDHPNPLHPVDVLIDRNRHRVEIKTLEGVMIGWIGDWIITGVQGEKYPCKREIFEQTYEAVE